MAEPVRDAIFISYSHKDQEWLTRLQTMMKPLVRSGAVLPWADTMIRTGADWREQIQTALATAKVGVMLVSPNFLASDFIAEVELSALLTAAAEEGLQVCWILVSACLYETSGLSRFQAAHDISRPLDSLTPAELNHTLASIAREINRLGASSSPASAAEPAAHIQFTAYHPKEVRPETWYALLAYAHLPAALAAVQADSRTRLGPEAGNAGQGRSQATRTIARGAEMVVVPELPGCRFNPPRASFLWLEDWHRAEFRVQATPEQPGFALGQAVKGRVAFYVGPVLVAEVPIWTHFREGADASAVDQPDTRVTTDPYQRIFLSYSHKDALIVQQVERAYTVLGLQSLRDVHVLRSGEEWHPALLRHIAQADIFQLYWSNNAKHSTYVEHEWRHALTQTRPSFIRPLYWEQPMPDPPPELAAIHFAYFPLDHESAVLGKREDQPRLTPLVGRKQEMGLLLERWAQMGEGLGQVVVLSGEAGIGKSRLVQEVKTHVAGKLHTRLECRCSPDYQHSAFYPVIDLLQRVLQLQREESAKEKLAKLEGTLAHYRMSRPDIVPLVASLLALPLPESYPPLLLSPQWQRQKTLEALLTILLPLAGDQPVLFIVEDLHWADPSTLELLNLLIDHVTTAQIFVLLTSRPEFRPPWGFRSHVTPITLSRLPRAQVEAMVARVAGNKALPAEVQHQLVITTDGVPLFVEELTKMVLESGLLREREDRYELTDPLPPLAIPTTLRDSLEARLDRPAGVKEVAQLGAILGREFSYDLLHAISPLDEPTLQQGLSQLVEAELLYRRGLPPQVIYTFKHALIQEAAYQSLLKRTRQEYHERIAQVLAERFPETVEMQPELLAHHLTEAGLEEIVEKIKALETVNFTTYYPRISVPGRKYGFVVYAHLPELRNDVNLDTQKFSTELGDSIPTPRRSRSNVKLARDTLITVVPECREVEFDPPELTKRWDGSWTRFLFDFKLDQELVSEIVLVRISIQVAGIEIACISNCAIEVIESQQCDADENPLAHAKLGNQTSTLYQRIFVSYSRQDREITERYKLAQIALGNEAFIDVHDLRAGENWKAGLARAIDVADVFQLFWSRNSANSEYCRYEWNYALEFCCPDSKCEGFVRPVYWEKPMPEPPPELSHVNFKYVPFDGNAKLNENRVEGERSGQGRDA
jgi:hypothetical protein